MICLLLAAELICTGGAGMTHAYQGCLENVSALMALVLNEGSTLAGSRQPAQPCLKMSVEAKAGAGKPKRKSAT